LSHISQEVLKNTPSEHSDHQQLSEARQRIDDVVSSINAARRIFEEQQKILDIQQSIDGIAVGRKVIGN
jgi:hypothetical protein